MNLTTLLPDDHVLTVEATTPGVIDITAYGMLITIFQSPTLTQPRVYVHPMTPDTVPVVYDLDHDGRVMYP
jgi:hypothetical protein